MREGRNQRPSWGILSRESEEHRLAQGSGTQVKTSFGLCWFLIRATPCLVKQTPHVRVLRESFQHSRENNRDGIGRSRREGAVRGCWGTVPTASGFASRRGVHRSGKHILRNLCGGGGVAAAWAPTGPEPRLHTRPATRRSGLPGSLWGRSAFFRPLVVIISEELSCTQTTGCNSFVPGDGVLGALGRMLV